MTLGRFGPKVLSTEAAGTCCPLKKLSRELNRKVVDGNLVNISEANEPPAAKIPLEKASSTTPSNKH